MGDFMIRAPGSFRLSKTEISPAHSFVTSALLSETDEVFGDSEVMHSWLDRGLADLTIIERCKFKPYEVFVSKARDQAWAKFDFVIAGKAKKQGAIEYHAKIKAMLNSNGKSWKLAKLEVTRLERIDYEGPVFADVSAFTGVDFYRSKQKQNVLVGATSSILKSDYFGGITVLDWNDDGAPDFMAYELESLLSVFINDGQGGFTRVPQEDLLPHKEASAFFLAIDLDGDGADELLGTRQTGCDSKGARIPIYQVRSGVLKKLKKEIVLKGRCGNRYVHVTAGDVNQDGQPDLFFSGFDGLIENSETQQYGGSPHNFVDAHDGARNRLVINQGGLKFEDRTDQAGIDELTRKTYLGHFFDYDADGVLDLFVVNDFAVNQMYKGSKDGSFEAIAYPPMTNNGFSMGVSVADFDADGDFDVYVSNMYSYAGNRVLGINKDLAPDKRATLLAMARGNTLYQRGETGYRELAVENRINNAQWAWGNHFFDYDNDGDLDLHVVNGLSSNPHDASKNVPDF